MIRLEQYAHQAVGVFGLGTAGRAAVEALLASDATVYAWDDTESSRDRLAQDDTLGKHPRLVLDAIGNWPWSELACVVLSPGVPLTHPAPHPVVVMAKQARVKVLGEVDLLYNACPEAHYIGITGTNGKSTTTALIAHILKECGRSCEVGGNLGVPALALKPLDENGFYVIEMSSYQLDLVKSVIFDASLLLNITPDHLDRHGGMEGYVQAKRRIFERQQDIDGAFIGLDDGYCRDIYIELVRAHRPNVVPFTVTRHGQTGKRIEVTEDGILTDEYFDDGFTADLTGLERLKGRHNWQNVAAAYAVLRYLGLEAERIMAAVETFPGLPHRLELVMTLNGVPFLNDSKATNADATQRALDPFPHIHWIAGGKAKEGGIAALEPYFPKIAHAYLIGEAQDDFAATLEGKVPYTKCGTLEVATGRAASAAFLEGRSDSVVLLSPACASFDQWRNFEERGDAFRKYVHAIAGRED